MSDSWIQEDCEYCSSRNWVCLGDMEDCTAADREGFICWQCGKKQLLSEISIQDLMDWNGCDTEEEAIENVYYTNGYKNAGDWNSSFKDLKKEEK